MASSPDRAAATRPPGSEAADATRRFGRGAAILSVGIGITGLVTYGFFSLASHELSRVDYGGVTLLWSAVFIIVSILYRPVEQLLSRTIAEREARGQGIRSPMGVAARIQLALGLLFAVGALILRGPIEDELFSGRENLFWILFFAVLAYAASYFARGFLAGRRSFGLYGLLVFMEATSRICFAIAVTIGIASGQTAVALGIVAAPAASLIVVPLAFSRRSRSRNETEGGAVETGGGAAAPAAGHGDRAAAQTKETEFTLAHGSGFAAAVLLIMFSEQTFLNAGPLLIKASEGAAGAAHAGFIFNILLIARAPLQLFQAISTSLLPHLTNLRSSGERTGEEAFRHSVSVTLGAVAAFAAVVMLALVVAGPQVMELVFGSKGFDYERGELVLVGAGMGLYLSSVTLNQAALAQGQVRRAAACWIACALGFIVWNVIGPLDAIKRVEVGFSASALVLCGLLYILYRRPHARPEDAIPAGSPKELEARLAAADEAS
jgi:O-antigen/teichoic acid export membrane protein